MLSDEEQKTQVTFSSLLPAARMATNFKIPLREMKRLIELAYYQEAKRRQMKMKDIKGLLNISMSKVGLLSKHLKEHFAKPEAEFGLPRMIMKLLWASPLSQVRIAQALEGFEADEIADTLAQLVEQKRIQKIQGRTTILYKLGEPQYRLVQDPWMARIDALNNLTLSVVQAVEARFFKQDQRAFARTLSFRVRPQDAPRLKALYEEHIFKLICELDELATQEEDGSVPMQLSVLWAPDAEWEDGQDGG